MDHAMNYCEHCQGQRFDRARVLRALRHLRDDLRRSGRGSSVDKALVLAMNTVRGLEIPHLEVDQEEGQVVH
jgi:hypothetical protein